MTLDIFRSQIEALPTYSSESRWVMRIDTYNLLKTAMHRGLVRRQGEHKQKRTHNGRLTKHRKRSTNEQD
jgi:hypothetical protein